MKKLLLVALSIVLAGCIQPVPKRYKVGQCVEISISGERGMVVDAYPYSIYYEVRVSEADVKHSALFGPTVTQRERYATVSFREFELRPCDD